MGDRCQYSFNQLLEDKTFYEIVKNQFQRKNGIFEYSDIIKESARPTCYQGIQCYYSLICLDWREICDGFFHCEHGEDEPEECLLLEINECNIDEYRCQFGGCIPKTFLIDFSYDCMDLSDEQESYKNLNSNQDCYKEPKLQCEFTICKLNDFSCGDGQCESYDDFSSQCNNGRDLFLRQQLLYASYHKKNSYNVSDGCWAFMLCIFNMDSMYYFNGDNVECDCITDVDSDRQCLRHFREQCPESFFLQTPNNFLYPFVQFFYQNISTISLTEWWLPTHYCFIPEHCHRFPTINVTLINGLKCFVRAWIVSSHKNHIQQLKSIFSSCPIHQQLALTHDTLLFNCSISMKFISKHRVFDEIADCYYTEDESIMMVPANFINTFNLTNHFKCKSGKQWIPRPLIDRIHCSDESDKLHIGTCKKASDIGCQFRRGLFIPSVYYIFRENCNSIKKLRVLLGNESDETSCEEWSTNRCDNYWDVRNGEDELNCIDTIPFYIAHVVLKCNINEHYCAYPNGTLGCLSKERAVDDAIDCLGATDERKSSRNKCSFENTGKSFQCSDGTCLSSGHLCDQRFDCHRVSDDEIFCPWLLNSTHSRYGFTCKNGIYITYLHRCNHIIDCQPDGEDEWLCEMDYPKMLQFSLVNIDNYPRTITYLSALTTTTSTTTTTITVHSSISSISDNSIVYKNDEEHFNWICNRGILVRYRSLSSECFCPPNYYELNCEYQSEVILITIRIDTPVILYGHQNQQTVILLVARLILDDIVYDQENILHIPSMKQMFYLNYPRPPPKKTW